ncbi:MAG: hypothetical protein Kow0040_31470 [Thermogutta sp.]
MALEGRKAGVRGKKTPWSGALAAFRAHSARTLVLPDGLNTGKISDEFTQLGYKT